MILTFLDELIFRSTHQLNSLKKLDTNKESSPAQLCRGIQIGLTLRRDTSKPMAAHFLDLGGKDSFSITGSIGRSQIAIERGKCVCAGEVSIFHVLSINQSIPDRSKISST